METPEKLLQQLKNLDSLKSIVKTMKALSAANIVQYDAAVASLAEYYRTIQMGLQVVLKDYDENKDISTEFDGHQATIIFGTDHGLCGRFNENIVNYALENNENKSQEAGENISFLVVGSRAASLLENSGRSVEDILLLPGSAKGLSLIVQTILLKIDEWRRTGKLAHVNIFYNRYDSMGTYEPMRIDLLPLEIDDFRPQRDFKWPSRSLPTYTMDSQPLLGALLRQYFFVTIFRACAESQASEHYTRLNAMHGAERNIDSRFDELTENYRRVRQTAITNELLDVVSGYDATEESR